MNHLWFRILIAIIAGLIVGSLVNMGIIMGSGVLIAPPMGADLSTAEGIKAALPHLKAKHFLMPFLAHALGTFTGSWIAAWRIKTYSLACALCVAIIMLCGGIVASFMIPAPGWFVWIDLTMGYLPMGWLGWKLARRMRDV